MTGWGELDRARQGGRKERCALHTVTIIAVNAGLIDLETMETNRDQSKVTTINLSNTKEDPGRQCYSLNGTTSFPIAVSGAPFAILNFQIIGTRQIRDGGRRRPSDRVNNQGEDASLNGVYGFHHTL
jgi:hypothetical protein